MAWLREWRFKRNHMAECRKTLAMPDGPRSRPTGRAAARLAGIAASIAIAGCQQECETSHTDWLEGCTNCVEDLRNWPIPELEPLPVASEADKRLAAECTRRYGGGPVNPLYVQKYGACPQRSGR